MTYLILHNIFLGYKDSWEEEDNDDKDITADAAVNKDPLPHATGFDLWVRIQDYSDIRIILFCKKL